MRLHARQRLAGGEHVLLAVKVDRDDAPGPEEPLGLAVGHHLEIGAVIEQRAGMGDEIERPDGVGRADDDRAGGRDVLQPVRGDPGAALHRQKSRYELRPGAPVEFDQNLLGFAQREKRLACERPVDHVDRGHRVPQCAQPETGAFGDAKARAQEFVHRVVVFGPVQVAPRNRNALARAA
jgi:hypothetical protein